MHLRRRPARSKGSSAVEMAIIAPVIVTLIMGQIEASRLGMVAQLLTTAAREGCRVAVVQEDVPSRVTEVLSGSGIAMSSVTVTVSPSNYEITPPTQGTPITVQLSVPYSQVSWLGTPYFLKNATVTASATMSSEYQ